MEKMGLKDFINKHSVKFRSLSFIIGTVLAFLAGLIFALFVDLKVKIDSETIIISLWLFFAIVLAVGGGCFYFFGDSVKHKRKQTLILKAVGLVLCIGYIVFLSMFTTMVLPNAGLMQAVLQSANTIVTICYVLIILAIISYVINYILSVVLLDEDY